MPKTGKSVQGGTINYSQWDHIEVVSFLLHSLYFLYHAFLMRFVGIR